MAGSAQLSFALPYSARHCSAQLCEDDDAKCPFLESGSSRETKPKPQTPTDGMTEKAKNIILAQCFSQFDTIFDPFRPTMYVDEVSFKVNMTFPVDMPSPD